MTELLGYEGIDRLYEFTNGLSPMLLLGLAGLGKKKWCTQKAEEFAGQALTKVVTYVTPSVLEPYKELQAGKFVNSWVIDITSMFKTAIFTTQLLPTLVSFLNKSTNDFTRVFLHSDLPVTDELLSIVTAASVPLLSNDQMTELCKVRGFEPDETEFAVAFAQGVPGEISTAFSVLKRRTIIFELRELLLEDNLQKLALKIQYETTSKDLVYLRNILTSFDTGEWTLYKEHEVSFLYKVRELMRNVLSYDAANSEMCFVTIFHAAAHAYHGRV